MKNVDKRGLVYIPGVEISCEKMIISGIKIDFGHESVEMLE